MNFRAQERSVSEPLSWPYEFRSIGDQHEIVLAAEREHGIDQIVPRALLAELDL